MFHSVDGKRKQETQILVNLPKITNIYISCRHP